MCKFMLKTFSIRRHVNLFLFLHEFIISIFLLTKYFQVNRKDKAKTKMLSEVENSKVLTKLLEEITIGEQWQQRRDAKECYQHNA